MNRTAALLALTCATVAVAAPSALAAPKKKPITRTYEITVPTPDVTNNVPGGYSVCAMNVPGSFDIQQFKVPAAGTLSVELTGFTGDMDLLLLDADKEELAFGGSSGVSDTESAAVRFKKATTVSIVGCNFASAPTGTIKYVFTYK